MTVKAVNRLSLLLFVPGLFAASIPPSGGDWPDWRGPNRDGVSREKNLPEKWSLSGQNLAWKAPYGGRSAPIIAGDRLYIQNTAGKGETEQERVMCFNADTGKLLCLRMGLRYERAVAEWCEEALDTLSATAHGTSVTPIDASQREENG